VDGAELEVEVRRIVASHHGHRGPLLPILHDVQAEFGFVPPDSVPILADALNLSKAEIWGAVTFYKDFHQAPLGARTVTLCRAEACQSVGGRQLADHARERFGIDFGETTADGSVSLHEVFCLGNCALGPSAQVNGALVGRLDAARLDELVPLHG
jgi:formate dehydrogenase subunit gamma